MYWDYMSTRQLLLALIFIHECFINKIEHVYNKNEWKSLFMSNVTIKSQHAIFPLVSENFPRTLSRERGKACERRERKIFSQFQKKTLLACCLFIIALSSLIRSTTVQLFFLNYFYIIFSFAWKDPITYFQV